MSPEEQEFQDFIDKINLVLEKNLEPVNQNIKKAIDEVLEGNLSDQEIDNRKNFVLSELLKLVAIFAAFTAQAIPMSYTFGANIVNTQFGTEFSGVDQRAVSILIRDTINNFRITVNESRSYLATFFEFSKQGVLTENQISDLVKTGLIGAGDSRAADKLIKATLQNKLSPQLTNKLTVDSKKFRAIRYAEIDNKNIPNYIKDRLKKEFEEKFANEQYLQLVDKNGKVRHYRIDSYSELVSRTRMGDAQVEGVIKEGERNDTYLFRVTSHNTKTPVCIPHEGKVYTSDRNNTDYPYLDSTRKPTYHPNCQHRLLPQAARI